MHPALVELGDPVSVIVGIVVAVVGLAFTIYKSSHDRHVEQLNERIKELHLELDRLKSSDPEVLKRISEDLRLEVQKEKGLRSEAETSVENLKATHGQELQDLRDRNCQTSDSLSTELEKCKEEIAKLKQVDKSNFNLIKKALRLEGRVWMRRMHCGTPRFRPLSERGTPIVSVLNLKGGVGKTTVTAQLGAALAAKGYRVLLVDLDLQGSLSSLFINETILRQHSDKHLLLQDFLNNAAEKRKANLLDVAMPILGGASAIIPTTDKMAYAELNLTIRWLMKIGRRDNRFLLRRALHQKRITNRYDIILMDCPPLFNTCCVNALAASDYIIIPTTPSKKAMERVPLLLERLKSLNAVINPNLEVLGLLLNRTHGSQLTVWETGLWNDLRDQSTTQWTLPVHTFSTFIQQTVEIRDSEHEFAPPEPGSDLYAMFSKLAAELEERIPRECRHIEPVPFRSE